MSSSFRYHFGTIQVPFWYHFGTIKQAKESQRRGGHNGSQIVMIRARVLFQQDTRSTPPEPYKERQPKLKPHDDQQAPHKPLFLTFKQRMKPHSHFHHQFHREQKEQKRLLRRQQPRKGYRISPPQQ